MQARIINLFERYGFEYRKSSSGNDFLAFTYKSGFFHNAELVSTNLKDKERIEREMESSVKDLEQLGFSTKKSFYESLSEVETNLFEGFFNVEDWKERIKSEYINHTRKVLSVLPKGANNYKYITTPFYKNNKIQENSEIITEICQSVFHDGPQLSIIEAPAGFGKTCTSYEVINSLVKNYTDAPIPFFTEFSRDRQARIFSHIFIREVDRTFSSVKSDVVIEEVKQGRIVVVLDGFDELLHDGNISPSQEDNFENAEPMLETISELLTNNAKVILTSRRSAIFDGEIFNEWALRHSEGFSINRYRIEKPEIKDWLPASRLERLKNIDIDIDKISNPVLLGYLRSLDNTCFLSLCEKPHEIVNQYFTSMLEREMERQELRMNPEKQTLFLKTIASDMCDNNYTSDSRDKLISTIREKAGYLLNEVRSSYAAKDKPTIDKLATTLSNHAFFDRSSQNENHVEFINEFVFGNYIAESIIDSDYDWIASDERFVEPAVLSYSPRTQIERETLWSKLELMKDYIDMSSRMRFESILTDQVKEEKYNNSEITSIYLKDIALFNNSKIKSSVFNDCTFRNISFNFDNYQDITFLSCNFWNCESIEKSATTPDVSFYNCTSNNSLQEVTNNTEVYESLGSSLDEIELYILEKIWPVGSNSIGRLHHFIGQILKNEDYPKRDLMKGIRRLKRSGYLLDANDTNFIEINKAKISEIKNILGRG